MSGLYMPYMMKTKDEIQQAAITFFSQELERARQGRLSGKGVLVSAACLTELGKRLKEIETNGCGTRHEGRPCPNDAH